MEILKVEHLVKQYGKGDNAVLAVNDISFSVEQGEFVAIVGSSGSGKSTLLHLLGGVDRPTSGKVYIQGEDIYSLNSDKIAIFRRRQVGLIYQFYNLIPILNVKENITLPCELDGRTPDKSELDELINTLGLRIGCHICLISYQVDNSRGYQLAGHLLITRQYFLRMSRQEILTHAQVMKS